MKNSHFLSEFVSHHRHCELHIPKMLHFLRRGPDEGETSLPLPFSIFFMQIIFSLHPPSLLGIRVRSLHRQKSILCRVRTRWSSRRHCLCLHTPLFFSQVFSSLALSPRSQLVSFVNGRNQLLLRWGSCAQNSQQFYNFFSFPRERWRWSDTIGNLINRKRHNFV